MKIFPSREQWKGWTLPSQLTAIGAYVGFISLFLMLFSYFLEFDIHERGNGTEGTERSIENACYFHGRIIDVHNQPVVGAEVVVLGKNISGTTDDNGKFYFKVEKKEGIQIQVLVKLKGHTIYNGIETLPGPAVIKLKDVR